MLSQRFSFLAPAIRVPIASEELPRLEAWYHHQQSLRELSLKRWSRSNGVRLIEPDQGRHSPHFGLLALAAWLERAGHDVAYYDEEWLQEKGRWAAALESMLKDSAAIFIGGITVHNDHVRELIGTIRKRTSAVIVAGGHHATYREADMLDAGADIVIRGEGELAAEAIAREVISGRKRWSEVPGCCYCEGEHRIRTPRQMMPNLEMLPPFPYHLLEEEQRGTLDLYVFPSRGCSYSCSFCAEGRYWAGHRMLPASRVCALIQEHQSWTPFNVVYLYDSSFGENRAETLAFCREFATLLPHTYLRTLTRLDLLDDELLKAMRDARIIEVLVGIESADENLRARSGKSIKNEEVLDRLKLLSDAVPLVKSSWMIGLPGETHESAASTAAMMDELHQRELVVEASCRVATYYPGSPCFEHPERHGLRFFTKDWNRYHRRCRPAYHLENMTSDEIYGHYTEAMVAETKAMALRLSRMGGA